MNFVFFGTADFGLPALQALLDAGHTLKAIVTNPPKPAGRGLKLRKSPVHIYCEEKEIAAPILTPESLKDEEFLAELKTFDADIFVVVAFSILPKVLFSIPPQGTYNIHAALLPNFRGPAPIHRAIETGATETGVTVFRIDTGVDTGNLLLQKSTDIKEGETTPELYERLSLLGGEAITESFALIAEGKALYTKQNHDEATHAPLLKKEEATIDWSESASTIYNKIRAFKPFPGTVITLANKPLGILKALPKEGTGAVGEVVEVTKESFSVACGEGVLEILEVKPAGKRAMAVKDFINGSKIAKGTIL